MTIIGSNEGMVIIALFFYACAVIAGAFLGALIYRWLWRRRLARLERAIPGCGVIVGMAGHNIEAGDVVMIAHGERDWQSWPEARGEYPPDYYRNAAIGETIGRRADQIDAAERP